MDGTDDDLEEDLDGLLAGMSPAEQREFLDALEGDDEDLGDGDDEIDLAAAARELAAMSPADRARAMAELEDPDDDPE